MLQFIKVISIIWVVCIFIPGAGRTSDDETNTDQYNSPPPTASTEEFTSQTPNGTGSGDSQPRPTEGTASTDQQNLGQTPNNMSGTTVDSSIPTPPVTNDAITPIPPVANDANAPTPPVANDAGSGNDAAQDSSSPDAENLLPETGAFPPVTDLVAAGPYEPVIVTRSGPGNSYTVYHPSELAPNDTRNPFVTWGNGILTTPDVYTLLPHLASHGFVVIASNSSNVTAEDLRAGLDWLFEENERQDSIFFGKLDTNNVASMGYSLGSDGTFKIADDPRLTTTVHISGGAFDKADTARLRNPAAFFCGGPGGDGYLTGDVANSNCESDFEVATVPVFYGVFNGGGHLGIMLSPYMELIRDAVTGWLRWQLMADQIKRDMFVGDTCQLCTDSAWTVKQKNLQ